MGNSYVILSGSIFLLAFDTIKMTNQMVFTLICEKYIDIEIALLLSHWVLFMESLSEILYGSLLSRKFYLLFFIICIVLCYRWIKNQISSLLQAIQHSWVDRRELEYISVPGFLIPCSLCCFDRHLKSLHLFRLLSEIKKSDRTAELFGFFYFSFILQKHLSVIFYYTI